MYSIVENVLKQGGYNLADIIRKIEILWVKGSLTDDEKDRLFSIARNGAKTENSLDILAKLNDLENRVRMLEENKITDQEATEYVSGKWYYAGDKISFEGENYVCIAPEGTVCVWSPKDYPEYWEKAV